jgi:hypothetical protein
VSTRAPIALACAAALLAAGGVSAEAKGRERSFPEGLYGNVDVSERTGDLLGFEVRFYTDTVTAKPMAEFVLCEGWCNAVHTAEVTRTQTGFAFRHVETIESYDDNGTLVAQDHLVEYHVVPSGKGWKVRLIYDGDDVTAGEALRIRSIAEPFGIAVARSEGGAEAP